MLRNRIFYTIKPLIPRRMQIFLRRQIAAYKRKKYASIWPIDPNSATPPKGWVGWPEGKQFALVLSHDVDTRKGYDNVLKLADLEEKMGFRSQFNFVPDRYGKIEIVLLDELGRETGRWWLERAWPCVWEGPRLDAERSSVALERLQIAYEEVRWERR